MRNAGTTFKAFSLDDLSEKISVVYSNTERNTRGDIVKTSELTRCTVWAKVLPISSKTTEPFTDNVQGKTPMKDNTVTYRVTVRYRTDILPDDIVVWRGKRLQQTAPPYDAESRRIWTVLTCAEMVKDGVS